MNKEDAFEDSSIDGPYKEFCTIRMIGAIFDVNQCDIVPGYWSVFS